MIESKRILRAGLLAAVLAGLAACGGSSGGGAPQTGQVAVIITDGPTDIYERVLLTLSRMTLIGSGGQQDIYDGPPITFDLLQLRDRADFAFSQQVAAGDVSKIRLEVSEIRLVDLGDPDDPGDDVEVVLDALPANGKIDLNPRGPFTIVAGRSTVVELDIDALRSFQVVQTGNGGLRFRPVIFVNAYDDDLALPSRMTRVFGTVEEIDEAASSLLLCNLQFVAQLGGSPATEMDSCVRVFAAAASHFGDDGLAIDIAALADAIEAAAAPTLTAIGFPSPPDAGAADNIVLDLDAVVTEFGPRRTDTEAGWETANGTVAADPTTTDCAAALCVDFQPADAAAAVTVQLQPETRVFRRDGTELAQTDLATGQTGSVDGLRVDEGGTEELRASLFMAGPDVGDELVAGALTTVTLGDMFDILTVQPEGEAAVSVCVHEDTDVLQIVVDDDTVTIADLLDPAVLDPADGLQVEASGEAGSDPACDLDAHVVIVE